MGIAHVVESRELSAIANTQSEDPNSEETRFKQALAEVKASLVARPIVGRIGCESKSAPVQSLCSDVG